MSDIPIINKVIYGILIFIHYYLVRVIFIAYLLFSNHFEFGLFILVILFFTFVSYYLFEVCIISVLEYNVIPIQKNKTFNFFSEKYEMCPNIYIKKSLFYWKHPVIINMIVSYLFVLYKVYLIHYNIPVFTWGNIFHRGLFISYTIISFIHISIYLYIKLQKIKDIDKDSNDSNDSNNNSNKT